MLRFKHLALAVAFFACTLAGVPAMAADPVLAPLAPLMGKTWRSVENGTNPDGSTFNDVVRWEWQASGHMALATHSLNEGVYGGVTLIHHDAKARTIVFRYATTGGFYTEGTIVPKDGGFEILETVKGTTGGPSDVRTFMKMDGPDAYTVESRMMVNGVWGEPQTRMYRVDPDADVLFHQ
ncbi:hypothetical protein [Gimibacter soli]|uniref:DUF1579 domain-containing protein n=1 Tax=Gimibacter soli TaxID=3024400 RepID=A0AAE9XS64_9PROT|nr:hypothetical protein [Gimibacter soli]WCL55189.1 hypothetical protein PH603_05375 [Gimibacter soli]